MVWLSEKWAEVDKLNDTITQYAREYLTMNEKEARKLQVIRGRENWYKTVDNEGVKILMNLDDATCDCGMWQMNGLPCTHAIAVFIMYNKEFPHNHVHWFYFKQAWQLTYEGVINPILDESRWYEFQSETIKPPVKRTKVGMPKKKRTRAPDEPRAPNVTFSKRCFVFGELGHIRATCKSKGKGQGSTSTTKKAHKMSNASACTTERAQPNECSTSNPQTTHLGDVCSQIVARASPGCYLGFSDSKG
ncbi:hypothetical protein QYF36_010890 [Acer negundo]|nr:hypothetical protein QYF36_010890 [Acer negundo]